MSKTYLPFKSNKEIDQLFDELVAMTANDLPEPIRTGYCGKLTHWNGIPIEELE